MTRLTLFSTALCLGLATGAAAQTSGTDQQDQSARFGEIVPLGSWGGVSPIAERGGWSAEALLGEDAIGAGGEDLGRVEDLIFGPEGELLAVIAEVGGFWDIGDTHVSIPWEEVNWAGVGEGVVLPITEETVDTYDLFGARSFLPQEAVEGGIVPNVDDAVPPGRTWRLSELVGDYARLLSDGEWVNYGYVTDVIVEDGEIAATIIGAAGTYGYGYYGYPSYASRRFAWDPADPYYDMPYGLEDVDDIEPVDRGAY